MSVEPPNPFLDRTGNVQPLRHAMSNNGMRQAFVKPDGQEVARSRDGKLRISGKVSTELWPTIDWASVVKFTRKKAK